MEDKTELNYDSLEEGLNKIAQTRTQWEQTKVLIREVCSFIKKRAHEMGLIENDDDELYLYKSIAYTLENTRIYDVEMRLVKVEKNDEEHVEG